MSWFQVESVCLSKSWVISFWFMPLAADTHSQWVTVPVVAGKVGYFKGNYSTAKPIHIKWLTPQTVRCGLAKAGSYVPTLPKSTWSKTTVDKELPDHFRNKCLKIFRELFRSSASSLAQTKHSCFLTSQPLFHILPIDPHRCLSTAELLIAY